MCGGAYALVAASVRLLTRYFYRQESKDSDKITPQGLRFTDGAFIA